ncbi:hypothetical protein PMAYCL1PPCAC_25921, partial [Pristionchus mayeri]
PYSSFSFLSFFNSGTFFRASISSWIKFDLKGKTFPFSAFNLIVSSSTSFTTGTSAIYASVARLVSSTSLE